MAGRLPFSATKLLNAAANRARRRAPPLLPSPKKKKSEWWIVDGEMHEVGDDVPLRERFHVSRDNLPNRRRKQLRAQFMRKTRLDIKQTEPEKWCKQYMELYQTLRENWERLYWDEGYSKRIAEEHAHYDSEEDSNADFSPNRGRSLSEEEIRARFTGHNRAWRNQAPAGFVRDALQCERERTFRERAFAPMEPERDVPHHGSSSTEPLDPRKFFS